MAKRYDKEFKLHAVKQVIESGKTATQVARELDIANQTLSKWVQKYGCVRHSCCYCLKFSISGII